MEMTDVVDELELRTNNPYSIGEILTLGDEISLERTPYIHIKSPLDREYQTIGIQKLSDIAFEAWGSSKDWWILFDVNDIDDPFNIPPGTIILVPDLDTVTLQFLD